MNAMHNKSLFEIWPIIRKRCWEEFYCTLEEWGFSQEMHIARLTGNEPLEHPDWEAAIAAGLRASDSIQRELWEQYDIENHPEMISARSRD